MNKRVENLKNNSTLVVDLIKELKYTNRLLKAELLQLSKSKKVAYFICDKAERFFEYELRRVYIKKSLRILASRGFEWLKPMLTNYLITKTSTLSCSTSEIANTFSKIEIKVIGELISRLDLNRC